jgi:hypothetical protein
LGSWEVGTATTLFIFAYGNFETANHAAVAVGRRKTNHYTPWHFLSKTINKDTDLRSATPSLQFNYNGLACRVQQLGARFTEEEICAVIRSLPMGKARLSKVSSSGMAYY